VETGAPVRAIFPEVFGLPGCSRQGRRRGSAVPLELVVGTARRQARESEPRNVQCSNDPVGLDNGRHAAPLLSFRQGGELRGDRPATAGPRDIRILLTDPRNSRGRLRKFRMGRKHPTLTAGLAPPSVYGPCRKPQTDAVFLGNCRAASVSSKTRAFLRERPSALWQELQGCSRKRHSIRHSAELGRA